MFDMMKVLGGLGNLDMGEIQKTAQDMAVQFRQTCENISAAMVKLNEIAAVQEEQSRKLNIIISRQKGGADANDDYDYFTGWFNNGGVTVGGTFTERDAFGPGAGTATDPIPGTDA